MRKLAWKLVLLGVLCLGLAIGISAGIDPYNVFHWQNARDNGVEPNKNYVKTQYVLHHPEKYNMFIFGNSRVGSLDAAKVTDGTCYNMYYSEGLPAEHYENITAFLEAGVSIKRIYLGIDDVTCFVDPALHDDQLIRRPFRNREPDVSFLRDYLNPSVALLSLETICAYHEKEKDFSERLYSTGNYYLDTSLTEEAIGQEEWPNYFAWYGEEALADIEEIVTLCEERQIELVVFINPEFYVRFEEARERGYLDFLRELAEITDYYSFCGSNSITCHVENFHDISHYRMETGDLMLAVMNGGKVDEALLTEGFGQYVTKKNVDEYLTILSQNR
ncbi:MAG: hypothetical protein NC231_01290 [Bacillus sp. (in: Bacteria)]|nr:hypothetical protein [Bacillus sp. (in: firmicutes)]MCM1425460.1 hypothetical protein [Eubacterium sp.]